jgi:hypothetical protein
MKKLSMLLCLAALAAALGAQTQSGPSAHRVVNPSDLTWSASPAIPPGGVLTVLSGDMSKPGPFVARLKAPDGYKIPAHWHPADEGLTVLSGVFHIGMGDEFDKAKTVPKRPGSFTTLPAEMRHFAWCEGETVVQLNAMGPFQMNYVDPKDDPRNAAK